jgi:ABC-2 type transport system ATP-binding protein
MATHSDAVISIKNLSKVYASGLHALKNINLDIKRGEIFALLGPNGAGKTTLISTICGVLRLSSGSVLVNGLDNQRDYRQVRKQIGLVPQEITTDMFETPFNVVSFSRGLFGGAPDPGKVEKILKSLHLWDKAHQRIMTLSGGMKRRVMIAKALSHDPSVLFLDEPTAGVDVNLRRDMWNLVGELRKQGTTIILTTHYIEEAQEMADRVGVINKGELILVEEKQTLMRKLGKKELTVNLSKPMQAVPAGYNGALSLSPDGLHLKYRYDSAAEHSGIPELLKKLGSDGIDYKDLQSKESSLEDIFVGLVSK